MDAGTSSSATKPGVVMLTDNQNGNSGKDVALHRPFQMQLGQMAHAAIAACLLQAQRMGFEPTADQAVIATVLKADPLRHDRRRGELPLRGIVRSYLEDFRPRHPWRLEGVERRLAHGRIDLLFCNGETGQIVVDELKSARGRHGSIDPDDLAQIVRYLSQLETEFGDRLLGVRLIMLSPPAQAYLFRCLADTTVPLTALSSAAL
jgi:hypothetical protein